MAIELGPPPKVRLRGAIVRPSGARAVQFPRRRRLRPPPSTSWQRLRSIGRVTLFPAVGLPV